MSIRQSLSLLAVSLVVASSPSTAKADEFWFALPPEGQQAVEGSVPDMVEGVLLREEEGRYVIRVVGGEIRVRPEQVVRRVETDLTVAAIEQRENEQAERLARGNERRREMLAAQANRMEARFEAEAAEAAARRAREEVAPVEAALTDVPPVSTYDPVLDRVVRIPGGSFVVENIIRNEYGGYIRNAVRRQLRTLRRRF